MTNITKQFHVGISSGMATASDMDRGASSPSRKEKIYGHVGPGPSCCHLTLLSFTLKAVLWGLLTYALGAGFATQEFWVVALGVFLFSVPIALSGFYFATVSQIRRLTFFAHRGWIYAFFSRRLLKGVFWVCWALASSFFMLLQFHAYSWLEWVSFLLVVPVFWAVYCLCHRLIAREMKPFLVTSTALNWTRLITPLIMLTFYVAMLFFLVEHPHYDSFEEAISSRKAQSADLSGSALVFEVSQYLAIYDGAKDYALGRLGSEDALIAACILGLGGLVVFFNACAMLSCLLIPCAEYRRIFGPLTADENPAPIKPKRLAFVTAVFTFISLFIYLPALTSIEELVRTNPEMAKARESAEAWIVPRLEQIDNQFFKPGTLDQLNQAKLEVLRKVEVSTVRLEAQIDRGFEHMEANVDDYLDWYYSLPAEYVRIMNLLVGQIEDYMAKKLEESLLHGDPFKSLEADLQQSIKEHDAALREYKEEATWIMDQNRVDAPKGDRQVKIVQRTSLDEILNPSLPSDVIGFRTRLGGAAVGGAAGGIVTGVVVKKVVGKVAGKNIFKLAAKSLAKIVAGKAAGTAGGATTGAAVGFWVGGPIGAFVGGVAGAIAVGVSVDKMLLMLESAISRDEFKREILAAIQESRIEFKAELRGK